MADLGDSPGVMEDELIVELEAAKDEIKEATQFGLIGKVIADRILNKKGVMNVLQSIWPKKVLLKVFDLGPNLYGFSFADRRCMEIALNNGQWTIIGYSLCLKKWDTSKAVNDIRFETINFWVQVHQLPLEFMTLNNARKIGKSLGTVLDIEDPDWVNGFGRSFMRIKIAMNLNRALTGRFKVPRGEGESISTVVKYEKLGDFCYNCGFLGHGDKNCDKPTIAEGNPGGIAKYGAWMRAVAVRGSQKEESAVSKVKSLPPGSSSLKITPVKDIEKGIPELDPDQIEDILLKYRKNTEGVRRNLFKEKETYDRETLQSNRVTTTLQQSLQ
ncbi:hypothetical protein CCACVL1_04463 [Corchorus capsularis]|uniref:CCHC-type domain-containing protein n=1 Tax=Corchorus capsularis TaxID=210143 RepID=A0A1R3JSU7_COCAP|nr:hypothetical protein CCACVL1_04463 [Corchorus capsularis]